MKVYIDTEVSQLLLFHTKMLANLQDDLSSVRALLSLEECFGYVAT